jgi:hypothetical protein
MHQRRMGRTRTPMWTRALLITALGLLTAIATVTPAAAAEGDAPGHDVSHPQCGRELPTGGTFGIVGLNEGRPFSTNPCLTDQYGWAAGRPTAAAIYVNTSNPAPSSNYYWPRSGRKDPALCSDSGSTTDPGCAYNYGWHAAANSLATGKALGRGVLGHTWWLDVETTNTWNGDGVSNTAVLQGMYDYLRSHGVGSVGLYSTAYQWKRITGGYSAATAADYRAAWQPAVVPDFPLHDAPLWIATAASGGTAKARCATSFTGGPTTMVQFVKDGFDTNLTC